MPFGISAGVSGLFNTYSARQAQKHQEKMYKHRYQWQVNDMRKAGINPMLTVSQAAPVSSGSAQAAPIDTSKSFSAGSLQRAQQKVAASEEKKNEAATQAANAQAAVYKEQAAQQALKTQQEALSHRHWLDQSQGTLLSSAKAAHDAGLDMWSKRGIAGVSTIGEKLGQWWNNRKEQSKITNARENRELKTSERVRVREKARKVRKKQPYSKDSVSQWMERQ